jgi:cytoskeletal protein RodZ
MDKKKILIIVGIVSVIGIGTGFYLWKKRKKSVEAKESTDDKAKTDVATDVTDKKTPVKGVNTPPSASPSASTSTSASPSPSATPPATDVKKISKEEVNKMIKTECGKMSSRNCAEGVVAKLKIKGLL